MVRTEQRLDPVNDMILTRLEKISIELKSTVKSEDINNLSTKDDLKVITDRIDAHEVRLNELANVSTKQQADINLLNARVEELGQRTADRDDTRDVYQQQRHIGPGPNPIGGMSTKRMNVIIEGIPNGADLYEYVIKVAKEVDVILYMRDLTLVSRLKRRNVHDKRPGPVLVCFVYAYLRDKLLREKKGLIASEDYGDVWIKADETMDVRRLKSEFRKIAYLARAAGETVYFNHEIIRIGDSEYNARNLDEVPDKYKAQGEKRTGGNRDIPQQPPKEQRPAKERETRVVKRPSETIADRQKKDTPTDMDIELGATAQVDPHPIPAQVDPLQEDQEIPAKPSTSSQEPKIRKTKYGIVFSGKSAYLSNLHECDVEMDDIVHKTNEHGYFFTKAQTYKRPDIAKSIIDEPNQHKLKPYFRGLGDNPEWKRIQAPTLRRLFERKMKQHPELERQLLDTAPYRLIEGSVDPRWGGGEPFTSERYDDGTFRGNNEFGDIATEYRDKRLAQLRREKITQR